MIAVVLSKWTASAYSGEDSGVRLDISSCVGTVEAELDVRRLRKTKNCQKVYYSTMYSKTFGEKPRL